MHVCTFGTTHVHVYTVLYIMTSGNDCICDLWLTPVGLRLILLFYKAAE